MVVDQRTLRANMLRNNIGANVFNKLTGQQAQTPAQQPTNTPITQTRGTQGLQQQPETYKVITNKFPTYDVKDIMGFGPQAAKNQLGFMQSVNNYNRLQAQANANTDPNVRYNLTKPQLTNKQTLQIEQATPETNEQGLKINKTNSFKDLVIDLQNVANQGKNISFMEIRDLYPEYVQNRSTVVDIFNDIKNGNTQDLENKYQKSNPEMFGVGDNFSNSDRTQALQRLYTDILNNKESGTKIDTETLTSKYPEFANTQDVNTIKEMENLLFNSENTPTINDIATIYPDLLKGEVEIGNAEKKTMKDDISKIENMSQSTYNHLSDEGKKYVEYLSTAEAVKQALGDQYYVGDKSGVEIAESLKNSDPELYKQIFGDVNISNLSEEDRKLLDEGYTIGAINSMRQQIKHSATEGLAGLGRKLQERAGTERKGERNPQPVRGQREDGTYEFNPLLKEDGTYETNPIKIREIKMAGNNYQQRVRTQEYRGKNPGMDKLDFKLGELLFGLGEEMQRAGEKGMEKIESSQSWKDVAELNKTSFWDALKKGDVKTMLSKSTAAIGQSAIPLVVGYATGNPVATFGAMYPGSYERAMQDIEADENLKDMTQEEKERAARLMATTESAIEEISLSMVAPKMFGDKSILDMIGGESFKKLMNNAIIKGITQTELGAASEGGEEVLQELFNNLITQSYGSDRELGDLQDYRNIFSETFLSSQLLSAMGGTMEGVDQARQNQIENQIKEQGELRNTVLEGQAIMADNFNDFASAVEQVPGTTTEELQQVWNNAQQKKQELEQKANNITSNSYNNVNVPSYERTTVKENEQPKLSAKDSQEYTDLLDEMEKNGEITKEDRKKVETELGIFTRNVEQPKTEGLANIQKTNETKSETSTEEKRNIIDRIVDKGASIVTKTVSAQDKLYKAQEPRMNVLSNKKNLEKRRANSDRANELIVENGYKPTNTEERLNAHQATLNKLWDQVKEQVKQGEGITVDQTPIINALSEYIAEKKKLGIAGIESEIKALERELNAMKKSQEQGKTDLPVLEQKKQVFNDMIDWKEQEASEVYKGGLRLLTHEIGKVEDDLISKIPGEFTKLKQDVGALLDTYEDVFKAHMKNQRSKGIGLTETYSRIEGIGDMLQGLIGVFKGEGGKVISGAGKVLLGKSLARAKDVDFLIKKGFEELSNEMGSNNKNDNDTTTDKNDNPPTKPNEPENNEQKPQTQPETEKKSEKKTDKAEQVQGMAEINQNKKTETKGLGEISNMKQPTLFQKGKGNPITKKQVTQLVKQLKKTGLAKDVKMYETQEDFEKAMEEEDARLQSVWHGSPNVFDRFDSSHMGEGEGNQAHGWGHYVAVNEDTGRNYAEMTTDYGDNLLYKGKEINYDGLEGEVANKIVEQLDFDYMSDLEEIKKNVKESLSMDREDALEEGDKTRVKEIDKMIKMVDNFSFEGTHNLYEVEIPDMVKKDTPTGSNYFEEGGEITKQQLEEIYTQLVKEFDKKKEGKSKRVNNLQDGQLRTFREWIDNNNIQVGEDLYSSLSHVLGGDKAASKFLESLGYDGIHYFGGRDGEAYVIFNDNALQITNHIKYLKDTHGDIAGAVTPDGTVHLIESNLRGDTATHEFSHLLWSYAKKNNPKLYKALQKIAREAPQELKDYVKRTYGEMTDEAFLDEVFAWKQGKYSGIKTARTWYQRMWDAIKNIWNSIKNSFGSKYADLDVFEAYETMSSEELMDRVDKLLKGGKEIGRGEGATQFEVAGDIYSNNFKNWFGDWENGGKDVSKVVDKAGKPLEVIHETYWDALSEPKGKAVFDKNMSESGGFWFSDIGSTPGYEYGDNKLKVYLKMQNPNIVKSEHFPGRSEIIEAAQKKGYDGAIRKGKRMDGKDYTVYYVNEPNQIKSATDNVGTYDPNNPDIRYEKIGGLSNTQIKKFAVQQGLAEISNGADKEYTVKNGKVKEVQPQGLASLGIRYQRTPGNINDLDQNLKNKVGLDYKITDAHDPVIHGLLDYVLQKKGISGYTEGLGSKFYNLNKNLPKKKNGDITSNMSDVDKLGYDVKNMIINWMVHKDRRYILDSGKRNKTIVDLKFTGRWMKSHLGKALYEQLKAEGFIVSPSVYRQLKADGIKRKQ